MLRLIGFILAFAVFLVFIILNLGNISNVNFGFHIFPNVPVFITALVSFFLGMLCTIPVLITLRERKNSKEIKEIKEKKVKEPKIKKKKQSPDSQQEEAPKENGPYGID